MSNYLDLLESELRAAVSRGMAQPRRQRPTLRIGAVVMALSLAASVVIAVFAVALLSHKPAHARPGDSRTTRQPFVRTPARRNAEWRKLTASVLSANVIDRDPSLWYRTVEIDKGSSDGVTLDDLVLGDGAVVGTIDAVKSDVSIVSLITDPNFTIVGKVEPSGAVGVLTAIAGDPDVLQLKDLPIRASITRGQEVVTSGSQDLSDPSIKSPYPSGITIGRISKANEAELLGHGQSEVAPAADIRHLATVVILTRHGAGSTVPVHHSRLVLNAGGLGLPLGQITFGAFPARLERVLYPLLGAPAGGYQATLDECGVDHTLIWPIVLNPKTGQFERAEELTLFFHRDRFVGYQYGGTSLYRDGRGLEVRATTAAGLAIGDPLSTGQRLYGRAFRISTAQGGVWQASTPHGKLTGYALGSAKSSDVSPSSRVASIDAGDVGCPALSP